MSNDTEEPVLLRTEGRAARIILNRPRALNALTHEMVTRIDAALTDWEHDPAVRTVVISGAGTRGLCAGGGQLGRRGGEAEAQRLGVEEAGAERLPVGEVGKAAVQGAAGAAEGAGGDAEAAAVQAVHRDPEALARTPEEAVGGDPDTVQDDLAGGLGVPARLAFVRAEGDAGVVPVDQEGGDAAGAGFAGAGPHHVHLGGARAGSGQAVAREVVHRAQPGQPALALGVVAVAVDHPGDHVVDGQVSGDGGAAGDQGLEDEHAVGPA